MQGEMEFDHVLTHQVWDARATVNLVKTVLNDKKPDVKRALAMLDDALENLDNAAELATLYDGWVGKTYQNSALLASAMRGLANNHEEDRGVIAGTVAQLKTMMGLNGKGKQ